MNPDQIFQLSNLLALLSWILLIALPRWRWTQRIIIGVVIIILAGLYLSFIVRAMQPDDFQNFNSLGGLMTLFSNELAVLAGWLHYLAFDLMTGLFILNSAQKHGVHHGLVIPCLLFTFMLGPTGLLLYLIIRTVKTRQYFQEYL